jgi:hypothetical protein
MPYEVGDEIVTRAVQLGDAFVQTHFPFQYGHATMLLGTVQGVLENGQLQIRLQFDLNVHVLAANTCVRFNPAELVALDDGTVRPRNIEVDGPADDDDDDPVEDDGDTGLDPNNTKQWTFDVDACKTDQWEHPDNACAYKNPRPLAPSLINMRNHAMGMTVMQMLWGFWQAFFPVEFASDIIIPLTNQAATAAGAWAFDNMLTEGEFYLYIGLLFYMLCNRIGGPRKEYWYRDGNDVFPPADLGRFMSSKRFEAITQHLTLGDNLNPNDKLRHWRPWLTAVRNKFSSAILPGDMLVADESMIENKNFQNADCITYIPRKPSPWGHELWTLVDCRSGILLFFILNEGAAANRANAAACAMGLTAWVTCELVRKWAHSNRLLFIDSWFQSVKTAIELLRMGIFSIGIVKTAHKDYPRQRLQRRCEDVAGALAAAWHYVQDVSKYIYAIQWRSSSHHKLTMLVSAGSVARAAKDYIQRSGLRVAQPVVAFLWYTYYGGVDAFNHIKVGKGKEGVEHVMRVHKRPNFPLFTGLLSMIEANMYLAAKHFQPDVFKDMTHQDFRRAVTEMLINNPRLEGHNDYRELRSARLRDIHTIAFYDKPGPHCRICYKSRTDRKKTGAYCATCGEDHPICAPSRQNEGACWNQHITQDTMGAAA